MEKYIEKAKKGDPDAFTILMQSHMQSMYKVARSILNSDEDVADAIQETILTCWEKLRQLQENRYFKTWMTRILINKCNDLIQEKRQFLLEETVPEVGARDEQFTNVEWKEMLNTLEMKL